MNNLLRRAIGKAKRMTADRFAQKPTTFALDRSIVSFTFDDYPKSGLDTGGAILEAVGYRGTYYASFGLSGTEPVVGPVGSREALASCTRNGHELACHTFSHIDCGSASREQLEVERDKNLEAACAAGASEMRNFAYPFGRYDLGSKRWLATQFDTVRTSKFGINRGVFDAASLLAVPIYSRADTWESCEQSLRELAGNPGWLIFVTHDVSDTPSVFGSTVDEFTKLVSLSTEYEFDVLTVNEAATKIGVQPRR